MNHVGARGRKSVILWDGYREEGFSQAEFPKHIQEMDYSCLKAHHQFLESSSAQLALPGISVSLSLLLSTTPLLTGKEQR